MLYHLGLVCCQSWFAAGPGLQPVPIWCHLYFATVFPLLPGLLIASSALFCCQGSFLMPVLLFGAWAPFWGLGSFVVSWLCQGSLVASGLFGCAMTTVSLRSCEYSKNYESFNDKIHYITMILYLNYKKNKKTVLSIKKCFQMYANII